jgi:hypothetical protein
MPKSSAGKNKVECVNPNSGRTMQIDRAIWDLFSKAIKHSLQGGKELTYTQLVETVYDYLTSYKIDFKHSVEWYVVTIKNDLQVKNMLTVVTVKGKKLHKWNTVQ